MAGSGPWRVGGKVEPVEILAVLDAALDVRQRVNRCRPGQTEPVHCRRRRRPRRRVGRNLPEYGVCASPIGVGRHIRQRQIIIVGDEIDVRIRPELVEMRPLAVLTLMLQAHPRRPIGRVGD